MDYERFSVPYLILLLLVLRIGWNIVCGYFIGVWFFNKTLLLIHAVCMLRFSGFIKGLLKRIFSGKSYSGITWWTFKMRRCFTLVLILIQIFISRKQASIFSVGKGSHSGCSVKLIHIVFSWEKEMLPWKIMLEASPVLFLTAESNCEGC